MPNPQKLFTVKQPTLTPIHSGIELEDLYVAPEIECSYDRALQTLWTTIAPKGIPCFSLKLLHDLERGSQLIEGHFSDQARDRPLSYAVLRSGVPGVFNVGGDLAYFHRLISEKDRAGLTEYARAAISVAYRNYTCHGLAGVTTIAVLEGDALGGGFECALSCDVVIAEKHVNVAFPEVLFNMFPGMGGLSFLHRRASRATVNELTRTGRTFSAQQLVDRGVIDQVVEKGQGIQAAIELMRSRSQQRSAHIAMNAIDRLLRPISLSELNEVVRMWVDVAIKLNPRGLEWMIRLHQQQLATFRNRLSVVS